MHRTIGLAALLCATPLGAQTVAIDSAVYREQLDQGAARIEPARRLETGDRVVTILTWNAPRDGRYTAISAVPTELVLESTSHPALDVSTDGGRSWRRLADPDHVPNGITHLRWPVGGAGRLSYRAVVR